MEKPDRERFGLEDTTAMGLVDFIIFAHHKPEYDQMIDQKRKDYTEEIITLADEQAVAVINGQRITINR